ncbi:methyl-accepting chemotaxis protein [Geobacter grbiciae]|uniref:methyl-accepting chemotaxis protein n=1 Tax=Geobacter grbiciae TaxID=155042 RepID=UPI001C01D7E9|nr:methyl-accepting chemotaxis protein [Geobacter grbiciae]
MKTRTWLYASAAVMLVGLGMLAFVSVYSIYDIRGIISQLTDRSTPLQIKTTELQRSIESLTGVLLRLGVATDKREVAELAAAADDRLKGLKTALDGIKALDATQGGAIDVTVIDKVYDDVKSATRARIESLGNYQEESRKVEADIQNVERVLGNVRRDMQNLTAASSKMVANSFTSSTQMVSAAQQVKELVIRLKDVQVVLKDLEIAKSSTEIFANKAKMKNTVAAIQEINVNDETVAAVKKAVSDINQKFTKPETGLVALKQGALSGKDTDGKFSEERRQINNELMDLAIRLNTATARIEKRVEQNRKDVEGVLASSQRIAGIDTAVSGISLSAKTLDAKVRSLMLCETAKDAEIAAADIRAVFSQITGNAASARRELTRIRQTAALRNIDAASTSVRGAAASVERIIGAQLKIIESNDKAKKALAMVKEAANRELKTGEELVRNTAVGQQQMVEKTNAAARKMTGTIIVLAIVIAVLSAIPLWYTIIRITRSLSGVTAMVRDIAEGEGDLTKRLDESGKDEFAELAHWFNQFVGKLHDTVVTISSRALDVSAAADGLSGLSSKMVSTSGQLAQEADGIATSSEQMSATSNDIANNCQVAAENAVGAAQLTSSGRSVMDSTVSTMRKLADEVGVASDIVNKLGASTDQIAAIITSIEDIADQTNLLALNAAIEAARAGEQGRGFAVVADEVRVLAERCSESAHEIKEIIRTVLDGTGSAVQAMERSVVEVKSGVGVAEEAMEAMDTIITRIDAVSSQVSQIATASEEQSATTGHITKTISSISHLASQDSDSSRNVAEAAERLDTLSEELSLLMGRFRT